MKSYTNNRYRWAWKSEITGYEYRLEMYPSDTAPYGVQTIIDMPFDSITNLNYEGIEHDKYPIGTPKTPQLKIKLNLLRTMNIGLINDALRNSYLYQERIGTSFIDFYWNVSRWLNNNIVMFALNVNCGNIWELWIKFNGDETNPNYRLMFQGIQQPLQDFEYDNTNYDYEVTASDINKITLENTDLFNIYYLWRHLDSFGNLVVESTLSYWDYVTKTPGGKYYLFFNPGFGNHYWFIKLYDIYTFLTYLCSETKKILLRNTGASIGLYFPANNFYKQTYNGSGAKGALLSPAMDTQNPLYILGWVTDRDISQWDGATWLKGEGFCDAILNNYHNAYDFLFDGCSEQWLDKRFFLILDEGYSGYYSQPIFYAENNAILDLSLCFNNKLILEANILGKCETSVSERLFDDIDHQEFSSQSRNNNAFTIPVIFHNKIPISDYIDAAPLVRHWGGTSAQHIEIFWVASPTDQKRYANKLFYFDIPVESGVTLSTENVMIGIHEHVNIDFNKAGLDSDTLLGNDFAVPLQLSQNNGQVFKNFCIQLQKVQGIDATVGQSMIKLFNNPATQFRLKGSTLIRTMTNFDTGVGCVWFNFQNNIINCDLSQLAPPNDTNWLPIALPYNHFLLMNVKINLLTEIVDYEKFSIYGG